MVIKRHFQFDAAHMLSQYEGKCSNLHGHTYTGDIEIHAEARRETGMVLDYNEIKQVVDMYDHAVIFSSSEVRNEAEKELYEWAKKHGMRMIVIGEGKCTAENIAHSLCDKIRDRLPSYYRITVWLHETPDSTAVATIALGGRKEYGC